MRRILAIGMLCFATGFVLVGQAPTLPGTSADRIGLSMDYQSTFHQLYAIDNNQNRQIRVIWANDAGMTVDPSQPWNFPYGSVLLFEDYPSINDDNGNPILDENGRFKRGALRTIFAMKKDRGFGAEYQQIRNGEWEYVSYNPDGSFATPPSGSGTCALCHLTGSSQPLTSKLPPINATNEYVFRADQIFRGGNGAMPGGVMQNYLFVPNTIHVKAGQPLTIYNDDTIVHTIAADDGSFRSAFMGTGNSYTMKFDTPGQVPIHCTLHSRMKGVIIVDPADDSSSSAVANAKSYAHSR
jgi:plastocyanin